MKNIQKYISDHYSRRIVEGRENFDILDWSDQEKQEIRFGVLAKYVNLKGKSLLDVGCGLGDLSVYLSNYGNVPKQYVGVDITADILFHARKKLKNVQFVVADIFTNSPFLSTFDIAYCSGIFNLNLQNNIKFIESAFNNLHGIVIDKIVANFLHIRTVKKYKHCFYYDPDEVITCFQKKFSGYELIDNYMENDFTLIIQK